MKDELDGLDLELITLLEENSGATKKQIAKKLQIPLTTVHNRIAKMEKSGLIKGYRAVIDRKKLGKGVAAYIDVSVNYLTPSFSQASIAKKIASMKDVEEVAIVTGNTDLRIKAYFAGTEEMNEFVTVRLRGISGIDKTNTMVILQELEKMPNKALRQ